MTRRLDRLTPKRAPYKPPPAPLPPAVVSAQVQRDLLAFGAEMLRSDDLDPLYSILRALLAGQDAETGLWLIELYLAFYNVASALAVFEAFPLPPASVSDLPERFLSLPTGIERRGFRTPENLRKHFQDYLVKTRAVGRQAKWIAFGFGSDWESNYIQFWETALSVWGNGRWAAFKWAELLREVMGYPLAAPDLRLQFCSGPREGLEWVTNGEGESVAALNFRAERLRFALRDAGLPLSWERLETVLCNYNSLRKGHYYIGHDIDEMQQGVDAATARGTITGAQASRLYAARAASFPAEYLGERNGWTGVDKARMAAYAKTGEILTRA